MSLIPNYITTALRNLEFIQRYSKMIKDTACKILAELVEVNEELDRITNNTQEIVDNTEELIDNTETLIENSETIITNTSTTNTNLEVVIDRLETINDTLEGMEEGVQFNNNETFISEAGNIQTFNAGVYHSISLIVLTGSGTITVNSVSYNVEQGYSTSWEASTFLNNSIIVEANENSTIVINTIR